MLKQFGLLTTLSLLLLIFAHNVQIALSYLDMAHALFSAKLSYIFNTSPVGNTTQEAVCLLIIPILCAGIPASIYWLIKRQLLPYFYHIVWGVWIILFTSLTLTR